jgi:hypothetical protein
MGMQSTISHAVARRFDNEHRLHRTSKSVCPSGKSDRSSFVPKPVLAGQFTFGPPDSSQAKYLRLLSVVQVTFTAPLPSDSAPYLRALVLSSWMAIATAVARRPVNITNGPPNVMPVGLPRRYGAVVRSMISRSDAEDADVSKTASRATSSALMRPENAFFAAECSTSLRTLDSDRVNDGQQVLDPVLQPASDEGHTIPPYDHDGRTCL